MIKKKIIDYLKARPDGVWREDLLIEFKEHSDAVEVVQSLLNGRQIDVIARHGKQTKYALKNTVLDAALTEPEKMTIQKILIGLHKRTAMRSKPRIIKNRDKKIELLKKLAEISKDSALLLAICDDLLP